MESYVLFLSLEKRHSDIMGTDTGWVNILAQRIQIKVHEDPWILRL